MTPNGSTKNSTKSNSAGASSQAIGAGREEADAMRVVSWPNAMLRSTPKDMARPDVTAGAPWHRNCRARATALLRRLLQIGHEIGELAGLLDAVEHHLGVRHLALGIAGVVGQRRFVPHDAGLDHCLGEVEARRRAGLAAEHAVQRWAGEARAILERVAGLTLLVEHALAASGAARLGEGLRG